MKRTLMTLTVFASVLLAGCNGQNPMDRESNPIKEYSGLLEDKPAMKVPPPPAQEPKPTQTLCPKVFHIGLEGTRGRLLKFDAGQTGKIVLATRWYRPGASYGVSLENAPKGMTIQCASSGCGRAEKSLWAISWNPGLNLIQDNTSFDTLVTVRISTNDSDTLAKCGSDFSEDFNVQVNAKVRRPVASVVGLPKGKVRFGEHVKFNLVVSNTDGKNQPQIMFGINEDAMTGEINYLDAQQAVGCTAARKKGEEWIFDCDWATDKAKDVKSFIDQNITRAQRFDVIVTSNGISSTQVPGILNVHFPAPIKDLDPSPGRDGRKSVSSDTNATGAIPPAANDKISTTDSVPPVPVIKKKGAKS